jgi:hypothetical protein
MLVRIYIIRKMLISVSETLIKEMKLKKIETYINNFLKMLKIIFSIQFF